MFKSPALLSQCLRAGLGPGRRCRFELSLAGLDVCVHTPVCVTTFSCLTLGQPLVVDPLPSETSTLQLGVQKCVVLWSPSQAGLEAWRYSSHSGHLPHGLGPSCASRSLAGSGTPQAGVQLAVRTATGWAGPCVGMNLGSVWSFIWAGDRGGQHRELELSRRGLKGNGFSQSGPCWQLGAEEQEPSLGRGDPTSSTRPPRLSTF